MTPTLILGDCLEVMLSVPEKSIDAIITDLPYGTTACKWDSVIPFEPMWERVRRLLKPGGAFVSTASQPFTSALGASNLSGLKYAWVWEKTAATGHLNARRMPMKNHEDILVFSDGPHTYNPQGLVPFGKEVKRGGNGDNFGKSGKKNFQEWTNYPRSILRFASDHPNVHPTQKPVALLEYLVTTYTNQGGIVLDPVMGSGTTGVACANTGRSFIGIERDPHYFEFAKNRILQPTL